MQSLHLRTRTQEVFACTELFHVGANQAKPAMMEGTQPPLSGFTKASQEKSRTRFHSTLQIQVSARKDLLRKPSPSGIVKSDYRVSENQLNFLHDG